MYIYILLYVITYYMYYYELLLLLQFCTENNDICQICHRNVISLLNILSEEASGTLLRLRGKFLWLNIWNPLNVVAKSVM